MTLRAVAAGRGLAGSRALTKVVGASFDELKVGMEVRYNEWHGDMGPQASTVHIVNIGGSRL